MSRIPTVVCAAMIQHAKTNLYHEAPQEQNQSSSATALLINIYYK
jgi:hypothetical protein